jgi:hypothetical protein
VGRGDRKVQFRVGNRPCRFGLREASVDVDRCFIFRAETIDAVHRAFEEVCGTLQLTIPGEQPSRASGMSELAGMTSITPAGLRLA